jgi:hypothetical protein
VYLWPPLITTPQLGNRNWVAGWGELESRHITHEIPECAAAPLLLSLSCHIYNTQWTAQIMNRIWCVVDRAS